MTTIDNKSKSTPRFDLLTDENTNFDNSSDKTNLLNKYNSGEASESFSFKTNNNIKMCIVDDQLFKIPSNYKCTNHYLPSDIGSSDASSNININNNRQFSQHFSNRNNHGFQPVDDDDILLQLAIQQSLSMSNDDSQEITEFNSQAINPVRNSSGTQSFAEYQERRNNLVYNQNDEDIILQR